MDEPKVAKKATKVEIIFERLSQLENATSNLKSNSKAINERLLGTLPKDKSDVAETVEPAGILQNIIEQLGQIRGNIEHTSAYLHAITEEIEKQ